MGKKNPLVEKKRDMAYELWQQGLSYKEIAEKMNTSKSNVQRWIREKKEQLKKEQKENEKNKEQEKQSEQKNETKTTEPIKPEPTEIETIEAIEIKKVDNSLKKADLNLMIEELNANYTPVQIKPVNEEEPKKEGIKEKVLKYKYHIIIAFVILLIIGGVIFYFMNRKKDDDEVKYQSAHSKEVVQEVQQQTAMMYPQTQQIQRNGKVFNVLG